MGQLLADWYKTEGRDNLDMKAVDAFAFKVSKHAMLAAAEFTRKSISEMPSAMMENRKMTIMLIAFSKALFTYLAIKRMNLSTRPDFVAAVKERLETHYKKEYAVTSRVVNEIWAEKRISTTPVSVENFDPLTYLTNRMNTLPDPGMNMGRTPVDHISKTISRRFFPVEEQYEAYRAMKKIGYLIGARFMVQM